MCTFSINTPLEPDFRKLMLLATSLGVYDSVFIVSKHNYILAINKPRYSEPMETKKARLINRAEKVERKHIKCRGIK